MAAPKRLGGADGGGASGQGAGKVGGAAANGWGRWGAWHEGAWPAGSDWGRAGMPAREKTQDWLEAGEGRGLSVRKAAGREAAQRSVSASDAAPGSGPSAPGSGPSAPGGDARLFPQDAQGQGVGGDEQLGERPAGGGRAGTAPRGQAELPPHLPGAGPPALLPCAPRWGTA